MDRCRHNLGHHNLGFGRGRACCDAVSAVERLCKNGWIRRQLDHFIRVGFDWPPAAYRFMPAREKPKWRWVSWGGIIATLIWLTASAAFSIYVAKFGNYNKSFGSLGPWSYYSLRSTCLPILCCWARASMPRSSARQRAIQRPALKDRWVNGARKWRIQWPAIVRLNLLEVRYLAASFRCATRRLSNIFDQSR